MDKKIKIELNNEIYEEDSVYASIALRGGFITKEYLIDNESTFVGSYAFYNILFQYWRLTSIHAEIKYDVLRGRSIIAFKGKKNEYLETLKYVLDKLFNSEYNQEIFEEAKSISRSAFENRYKAGKFRGRLKSFEFSDLNKRFQLRELINDIEVIDFNTFKSCAETLLVPGNIYLYINGDVSEAEAINSTVEAVLPHRNHSVKVKNYYYDPYLKQDAHLLNLARENFSLTAVAFDFLNRGTTIFAKQAILDFKAAYLPYRDIEVYVDSLDASLIFENETLKTIKPIIHEVISEEQFDLLKKKILQKYLALLKNYPELFAITGAEMLVNDVSLAEYIAFIGSCTYELYCELCDRSDFIITEAQVVLKKEAMEFV
ncbi:hypothetical protein ACPWSR_03985 [Alloiococcus sp. CFN-8]|uniref:hypothetical protein n=1 Tax=Alloiococcus sp. CFN-8 TaxID=3416081 RepID=UPI003CF46E1A